jgi:hypothetical protein
MGEQGDISGNGASQRPTESGRAGRLRRWRVGEDRVELAPDGPGWTAQVHQGSWGGLALTIDGHFGSEAEALAWCCQMAGVLARDQADEAAADSWR